MRCVYRETQTIGRTRQAEYTRWYQGSQRNLGLYRDAQAVYARRDYVFCKKQHQTKTVSRDDLFYSEARDAVPTTHEKESGMDG